MSSSEAEPSWLTAGIGTRPGLRWSFCTDAPLVDVVTAAESGEVVAADESGSVYLLDRRGRITAVTRGFSKLTSLSFSDTGGAGAAAFGEATLCWFDTHLAVLWSVELPDVVLAVSVDPFGQYVAASLANGRNYVFDSQKRRISRFESIRPLSFIRFLAAEPILLGAADHGLLCCHRLDGDEVWREQLWSTVGDVAVTGDGKNVYLAGFTHGIQAFDGEGTNRGSYLVEGSPKRVSTSYMPKRIAAATVERHLYWLDSGGELKWATSLPEDICSVRCEPLGRGLLCGLRSGRLMSMYWHEI